jgi:hypothetical protein
LKEKEKGIYDANNSFYSFFFIVIYLNYSFSF